MPYVDEEFYNEFSGLIKEDLKRKLQKATNQINSLTFNRIVKVGFDNLTEFQQNIVKDVICELADFTYENEDVLDTILTSYSINGVSMNFGSSWNIKIENGVAIPRELYSILSQTGLTCKNIRWR